MLDTLLTNYFAIFPSGFFVGIVSVFVCIFVIATLLDIINL